VSWSLTFSGWVVNASARDFDSLVSRSACLSASEWTRVGRFHRHQDVTAFIARRVFLREVLATELGVSPQGLSLRLSSNGKPEFPDESSGLWFSQSSTSGLTVVALSREGEVGVDVENLERAVDHEGVARRWFRPHEISRIELCGSDEARRLEFMRTWTAREAAAKVTGEGMAFALSRHELVIDPLRVVSLDEESPSWIETRIDPPHVISVAWSSPARPTNDSGETADRPGS